MLRKSFVNLERFNFLFDDLGTCSPPTSIVTYCIVVSVSLNFFRSSLLDVWRSFSNFSFLDALCLNYFLLKYWVFCITKALAVRLVKSEGVILLVLSLISCGFSFALASNHLLLVI